MTASQEFTSIIQIRNRPDYTDQQGLPASQGNTLHHWYRLVPMYQGMANHNLTQQDSSSNRKRHKSAQVGGYTPHGTSN
jgi:hypothetical protein